MPKLYIPTKKAKKVTLKVEVTQETLERFILYQEYLIERLGNDAEARASVDPGDIITHGLKSCLESAEFEHWRTHRNVSVPREEVDKKIEQEVKRMMRAG